MGLFQLGVLQNWDVVSVGIAVAAIGILAFIVYFNDQKSITNKTFLVFAFFTICYGIFNYINYHVTSPFLVLWFIRITIFFAVWHAFSFFQFFYVFPEKRVVFSNLYKKVLVPSTAIISILTLTPFIFSGISNKITEAGSVSTPQSGPGVYLFGMLSFILIVGGIFNLAKKIKGSIAALRTQYDIILLGTVISFSLLILFNIVLPLAFNNVKYVPLAPVFILPFIVGTAYAIIHYHLLDIKVITTEILIFFLAVSSLFETLFSTNITTVVFRFFIFLLILGVGILLIRSVRREVEQRELLQKFTDEMKIANEKLKALDIARAEFISIASHQLRTPPATVKWYLSAVLTGDYGEINPEVKAALTKTERTNNSLISLIEDMLNVSRIERGKMEFLFQPTKLLDLAELTFEQLEPIAHDKKLDIVFNRPHNPLPEIMADKEKLRQVMNNLIDNAIKYTKQGSITVSLSQTGDDIRFEVTDTGKGMDLEAQGLIFEKYSRGKESIKQSAGLGLGLYVAKVIIRQHKGKIWAESPGTGKGSSFIFTVPINSGLKETTLLDLNPNA